MKLFIDILEIYKTLDDVPKNDCAGAYWNEGAIIGKAHILIGDFFPMLDAEMLAYNGRVFYSSFKNEYPSSIPIKIGFDVAEP